MNISFDEKAKIEKGRNEDAIIHPHQLQPMSSLPLRGHQWPAIVISKIDRIANFLNHLIQFILEDAV